MVDGNFDAEAGDFKTDFSKNSALVEINPPKELTVTVRSFSSDSVVLLNLNSSGRGFAIGEKASVTLENIEISYGRVVFVAGSIPARHGGGILCKGNLSLRKCSLRNNYAENGAGGGIYFEGGTLNVSNCEITDCRGSDVGGGIYCEGNSSLQNCAFEKNSGRLGGAIEFSDGEHSVSGCKFIGNKASSYSGAICCVGNGTLTISDSEFKDNESEKGGAIYLSGGEFTVTIESGIFSGNKSWTDTNIGAIYVGGGNLRLGGSVTIENSDSNGICLAPGKTIEIISKLSPENSAYTAKLVFEKSESYSIGQKILVGGDGYAVSPEDYGKFLISDSTGEGWHINQYGYLTKPVSISTAVGNWNPEIYTDITVSSLEELEKFASFVNDGNAMQESSIKLKEDITIDTASSFAGIGNPSDCPFSGIFDGNGKTITSEKTDLNSIFLNIKNGTIKNLKSAGTFTNSGIVKEIDSGIVENCENSAKIGVGHGNFGGIVSKATNSSIIKCINRGVLHWLGTEDIIVGGICGSMNGGKISDCMNVGSISVFTFSIGGSPICMVGGILGYFIPSGKEDNGVFNSVNRGDAKNKKTNQIKTGGVIGAIELQSGSCSYVRNCLNMGCLTVDDDGTEEDDDLGGILCVKLCSLSHDYKFGVSDCYYSTKEPFDKLASSCIEHFEICKVNSFSKFNSKFFTNQELTVGNVTSTNLVELLNAWVEEENSSGGAYLKWQYSDSAPVEIELVYEN